MGKIDKKIKEAQEEVVYWWTQIEELHQAGKLDEEMAQKIVARIQDLASLIEFWKELQQGRGPGSFPLTIYLYEQDQSGRLFRRRIKEET